MAAAKAFKSGCRRKALARRGWSQDEQDGEAVPESDRPRLCAGGGGQSRPGADRVLLMRLPTRLLVQAANAQRFSVGLSLSPPPLPVGRSQADPRGVDRSPTPARLGTGLAEVEQGGPAS